MRPERNLLSGRSNALVAMLALVFLYLPIATLVALSFNENDLTTIWSGFSLKWYAAVLDNGDILRATKNSLIVALVATALASMAATAAALGVVRSSSMHRVGVEGLLSLLCKQTTDPSLGSKYCVFLVRIHCTAIMICRGVQSVP